jgi:hypothetical protein
MSYTNIDTGYYNDFELQLKEANYRWFKDNWKNSLRGFQKEFTDELGTKYFITGYHYNHSKQLGRPELEDEDSYMFDVRFTLDKDKGKTINITFSADFLVNPYRDITTLQEVEDFYEETWNNMKAEYYKLKDY